MVLGDLWEALQASGLLAGDLDPGGPLVRNLRRLAAGWLLNFPGADGATLEQTGVAGPPPGGEARQLAPAWNRARL